MFKLRISQIQQVQGRANGAQRHYETGQREEKKEVKRRPDPSELVTYNARTLKQLIKEWGALLHALWKCSNEFLDY